jgi:hypothetical protein
MEGLETCKQVFFLLHYWYSLRLQNGDTTPRTPNATTTAGNAGHDNSLLPFLLKLPWYINLKTFLLCALRRQSLYLSIYPSGVFIPLFHFFSLIYAHFFVIQSWCLVISFSPRNKSRDLYHVTRQDFLILNLTLCKRGPSDSRPAKANRKLKIEQITLAFHT